jgi:histidinol-phosphate aminotransferase
MDGDFPHPERSAPRAALAAIAPYQPGMSVAGARSRHPGRGFAKLSSNENPHGPSPKALAAAAAALASAATYPDSRSASLKRALAAHLSADPAKIVVGPGSEALIDYFFRAYLGEGDVLLLSRPTFPSYEIFARSAGAAILDVPRRTDFSLDVEGVIAALASAPKALALCSPNNPTGNRTPRADLARIIAATPLSTVILMDEAYAEFHGEASVLALLQSWGGVFLLTRTFSKAYGLAGLRIGYGLTSDPEVGEAFDRLRPAFNLTSASQAAAEAALADSGHLKAGVAAVIAERERLQVGLAAAGIAYVPSEANFVFVRAPVALEATFEALLVAGVIARPIPFGEGWLRISVGLPQANDAVVAALAALAR